MGITLNQARRADAAFDLAEVESVMGVGYCCHLIRGEQRQLLTRDNGEALRLPALTQVRAMLRQLPLDRAELVHRSPYGEMIGQAGDQNDTGLRLPIRLSPEEAPS
jgi:bacterioferritin-associated ferredoxin